MQAVQDGFHAAAVSGGDGGGIKANADVIDEVTRFVAGGFAVAPDVADNRLGGVEDLLQRLQRVLAQPDAAGKIVAGASGNIGHW